jgi:hypothetical protein
MGRTDDAARTDALAWLEDRGVEPDHRGAIRFDDIHKHALAPLAIYTLLQTADAGALGNGFARAELPNGGVGVFEYDHGPDNEPAVHILRRPDALGFATNVIGLDGTPTPYLWDVATGCDLSHRVVLEDRRAEYVEHALGYRIVQTSEYSRPYHNMDNVNTDRDAALLQAIEHRHGESPGVITTSAALLEWDREGAIDVEKQPDRWDVNGGPVGEAMRYGNLLGSNRFGTTRVGAVIGSSHYGDGYIGKWAAYAGESATLGTDARSQDDDGRMTELDYGPGGNQVHEHMQRETLQAMFRFGRDGDGATVYVDTDVLPDWVPVHGRGEVTTMCDGLRGTIEALEELDGPATTAEIEAHDSVGITARRVRSRLGDLRDLGAVETSADPDDGRRDVHQLTDHAGIMADGVVTLPEAATKNGGESCGREPYSNTIGNTSATSDGDTPTEEAATAAAKTDGDTDGETDESTLDYPDMAADPDEGTDWQLTERVIGMPDAEGRGD